MSTVGSARWSAGLALAGLSAVAGSADARGVGGGDRGLGAC